jgi:hypothetical protein
MFRTALFNRWSNALSAAGQLVLVNRLFTGYSTAIEVRVTLFSRLTSQLDMS